VAGAIIERDGKILLVKENSPSAKGKWSHPAGWIEVGESPIDAVRKEVREETGFDFNPKNILGVYSIFKNKNDVESFHHGIKIIYIGKISENQGKFLQDEISETKWFAPEEIEKMDLNVLRDLDIKQMVKDYFSGTKYPLDLITHTTQPE